MRSPVYRPSGVHISLVYLNVSPAVYTLHSELTRSVPRIIVAVPVTFREQNPCDLLPIILKLLTLCNGILVENTVVSQPLKQFPSLRRTRCIIAV
jgi:hypothetical protein